MNHNIPIEEINKRKAELEPFLLGIRKEKPVVKIQPAQLDESHDTYGTQDATENGYAIKHAIHGENYHEDLERLHTYVKPYIPTGSTFNAEDNYIHDTLKKGKPSGNDIAHILTVMHHGPFGTAYQNSKYLKHKWEPFLKAHLVETPKIKNPAEATYSLEELNSVHPTYKFRNLRMVEHPAGHLFEFHPTEGLRYLGNDPSMEMKSLSPRIRDNKKYANLSADLSAHYAKYPSDQLRAYTKNSSTLNRHLWGTIDADELDHADSPAALDAKAHAISQHLHNMPHLGGNAFHVYTGIGQLNNPNTVKTETSNGEKIIHSPSFTSTSLNRVTAEDFAGPKKDNSFNHHFRDILKIEVPGGYPRGAFVKPYSDHAHEEEYVMDKGHTFIVHPKPTYYTGNSAVYRLWNAKIHPSDELGDREWSSLEKSEKIGIALSPHTGTAVLQHAADDETPAVRAAAAKHPNLSAYAHEALGKDEIPSVRESAMLNPNLPNHMLHKAFETNDAASMRGIAKRPHIEKWAKDKLVNSDFSSVQQEVAKRHDLESSHIHTLIDSGDEKVHGSIARNTSILPEHVDHMLRAAGTEAVRDLAGNPAITKAHIRKLTEDPDTEIRMNARYNPKNSMLD